jgi:hypothetical protein
MWKLRSKSVAIIWLIDWLIFVVQRRFQQYFSYIMETSFSSGRSRSTRRESPIMGKQLVSFITCGANPRVLVIGLYDVQVIQLPYSLSHPLHYFTLRSEVNVSLSHLIRRVRWAIVITWGPSSVVCRPSVRKQFNPFLENHWSKWYQTRQECSLYVQTKCCYFR